MSSVVISGDTSGAITLSAPAVAGTNTITLPAQTGTAMVNGPTFFAYLSGNQTISFNTNTKIPFNAELFDTANCFDSTTNYRFTPNVAGYYQINLNWLLTGTNGRNYEIIGQIFKNGATYAASFISVTLTNGTSMSRNLSAVVYMNGSTDYVEGYAYEYDYTAGSTVTLNGSNQYTSFSGAMVRSA